MGLLDDVTKLAGSAGGALPGNSALLKGVLQMLGSSEPGGGLTNIVQGFHQTGLSDVVSSWVSTGHNLPISAEQLAEGTRRRPRAATGAVVRSDGGRDGWRPRWPPADRHRPAHSNWRDAAGGTVAAVACVRENRAWRLTRSGVSNLPGVAVNVDRPRRGAGLYCD